MPPAPSEWGQPQQPGQFGQPVAPKKGGGGKIALIIGGILALVLLCVCGGVGIWFFTSDDDEKDPIAQPTAAPTARPTDRPSADPTPSRSSSDDDDTTSYKKGDCLKNEGTNSSPKLRKVPCGPGTYEVLSRIPFTTDVEKCKTDPLFGAKEADANYYYDSTVNSADYVLCLKKR
ncbi:hypothetical protein GCM10027280_29410 [Micromonospora polyrhachis]|uniref:Uncharacterized protein n=1 Tax=Micromonospora polyrhachis TaxID=1282883 RepID=A0A7W7SQF6_9ACTN|nr:hypothetical protein [Micromonospora polyrhachis]